MRAGVSVRWYRILGPISADIVREPKAELFYWLTSTFSQALGTALGDWTADTAVGVIRRVIRYGSSRADDGPLPQRLRELAAERRQFGYRRLGYLLARDCMTPNHKKLLRVYREENLRVRRRGGRKRALDTRAPMVLPDGPNQCC